MANAPPTIRTRPSRSDSPARAVSPGVRLANEPIDKLTAGMAAGDAKAVESFYRRYFDWLYAQARRATRRDEAFCLDVVQDAVLRIVRTIRRVSTESELRAWLRLVVQTTALDRLRCERRRQK